MLVKGLDQAMFFWRNILAIYSEKFESQIIVRLPFSKTHRLLIILAHNKNIFFQKRIDQPTYFICSLGANIGAYVVGDTLFSSGNFPRHSFTK